MKVKTNEELLKEIQKLKQENSSLLELYKKDIAEHKIVEKALLESEERFQLLFNKAPLGYQSLDVDGNFLEVNQAWIDTLGYTHDEVIGKWFGDFLSPAYQDGFRKRFPIFKAQGNIHSEFEMIHKNGTKLFIAFDGRVGYDHYGEFKQTHCILQDITERKKGESALIESKKTAERYLNVAAELIMSLDAFGNIVLLNDSGHKLLGYNQGELIGKNWFKTCLPQEISVEVFNIFKKLMNGDIENTENYENPVKTKSGEIKALFWHNAMLKDSDGKITGIISSGNDITYIKKTESDLIKAKETAETNELKFRNLFENSPIGKSMTGIDGSMHVNKSFCEIVGYFKEELLYKRWKEISYPDDIQLTNEKIQALLNGEAEKVSFEKRYIHKNGSIIWADLSTYLQRDKENKPEYFISTIIDITQRKQSESKLKGLSTIIESSLNEVYVFNQEDLKFVYVNSGALRNIGFSKEEMLTMTPLDIKPEFTSDTFLKTINPLITYEQDIINIETVHRRKDGSTYPVDIYLQLGNFESSEVFVAIIIDITERKRVEKKLVRSEYELKRAQQITHIGSWYLDVATNEVVWSEELYKMYGFNPALPPPPYTEHMKLFTPESWELLSTSLAKTTETGVPYELELQTVRKDGSNGWMWVRGEAQTDSEGNIVSLWGAAQDISEYKEREELLEEALKKAEESDRLKSAFLANMSHEIRTPMNGILGFTELLKEPNLSTDDQQDFIQTIQISGDRMLNTINNIVDVSKIESGLTTVVIDETNINKKIEFTYKFFKPEAERKGLQLLYKNDLPIEDAVIKTDNEKVYGILTNLIKNAIKFTYDGLIEFGYVLKSDREPAELEFFVKDTGVGIPKNQQEFIFERFRQGSNDLNRLYEGSGLGLSIAKSYVEMLGGKIWVESEVGKGSTFYFTIPYHLVKEVKTEIKGVDSSEIKKVQLKNLKILIVEDDEVSYSLLKRTIQKIGKEVLHAITGVEAIEACRTNPDLNLVLMDIRMPVMDGNEATRKIRQFNKNVVIIAQTAYVFAGDKEKALEAGCNDYISKPIDMTLLFELIKKHTDKLI